LGEKLTFGFARMREEAGERRDFLPETIGTLEKVGAQVYLEHGYGSGMGFEPQDYKPADSSVVYASHAEVYQQDYVIVLRCPAKEDLRLLRPGACLVSMLHYPTRPERTAFIRSLGVEAISLDSLKDDTGRRLVENLRSVAWNGMEVAFRTLRIIYPSPGFDSPHRDPVRATLMGSGAVGMHVVQAAIRHGDLQLWQEMIERGTPGVQVTVVDFDTTPLKSIMLELLSKTDILIDATQRAEPDKCVIPNDWVGIMPKHAVLLDLSVDPYDPPRVVKGIEGIPQGNLDQYIFAPDDPVYEKIPNNIPSIHRRYAVSCYSWPGIHPRECMLVYHKQLRPIFRTLVEKGCVHHIDGRGKFFERAIQRARLSQWKDDLASLGKD
jgi:alanine dehydrogenase